MKIKPQIVVGALVTGLAVAAGFAYLRRERPDAITYREVRVERADLATSIQATGTVQPENRLEIKPPIAGRVEKVLIEEGQRVRKGQILAWMSSTERAALLDAAHSEGREEEARWEQLYKPTPIMAPINGTIITRSVESGQTFTSTDAILVMSDRLTVKAQVDETDISQVKLGQAATITLDAYPAARVPAKVDQIAFDAKTVNNVTTYTVDVLPEQTPKFMRSGMTANVNFVAEAHVGTLVIPSEAIKIEDGTSEVTTRGPAGGPEARRIETGLSDGRRTEVTEGLAEGEILLLPVFKLKAKASGGANPFMPTGPKRPRGGGAPPGH